jgi:hypothetical protein
MKLLWSHSSVARAAILGASLLLLNACGGGGSGGASVAAPTVTLTATAGSVASGDTDDLNWSATNATSCTASGGWSGSKTTSGSTTTGELTSDETYTLTCTGAGGSSSATATVTVTKPAPTVTLTASPTTIAAGASSTLTWSSMNATACTASGSWSGAEPTSGSAPTGALTANASYTLTCNGAGGSGMATATVTVTHPQPAVTLTANPTTVAPGATSLLTWNSTNATGCTASGGWSGAEGPSGTLTTPVLNATTTYNLTCTGAGGSGMGSATVTVSSSTVTISPAFSTVTSQQTQQLSAAVPGTGTPVWSVDNISGGNSTVGTVSPGGLYTPGTAVGAHTVTAVSSLNASISGTATVVVTDLAGIYTFHNDMARTGQNLNEYALTPALVSGGKFGKLWSCAVDGDLYAQPLYVANLSIGGGIHNVLFVATGHDSVYAIDADSPTCHVYWQKSVLSTGVTTIPPADVDPGCSDIPTEFGITGTPVIDPVSQTIYFVAATKESGSYVQRLHRLSLATGAEVGTPIAISGNVPTNSYLSVTVNFEALYANQRPALALANGQVYIGWSGHCDIGDATNYRGNWFGWVMAYDASALTQTAFLNTTPNGFDGGVWMSGDGPAIDSAGEVFVSTGNGDNDGTTALPPGTPNNNYAMSFLNLNPTTLAVTDFYTPSMWATWSYPQDLDISSSGLTVLPDSTGPAAHPNLLVGSDKQGHLWSIDRSNMGQYSSSSDNTVQFLNLPGQSGCNYAICVYSTPAYSNGTLYIGTGHFPGHSGGYLLALPLSGGLVPSVSVSGVLYANPSSMSTEQYSFPSPTPMISASMSSGAEVNAVVWVLDNSANGTPSGTLNEVAPPLGPAILRAYDATNLATTLYDSSMLSTDTGGNAIKFTVPVVANGHVYVGGSQQLTVYGVSQ